MQKSSYSYPVEFAEDAFGESSVLADTLKKVTGSDEPKVLIVALFTFFAVPTTLLLGLRSLDPGIVDLFRMQGAGWGALLWQAGPA